ncbi:probable ATP-dependent RNA helicase vasa-like [Lepeophtheirus salmonis]|uniref:RNA helicase n=1 Tax=Lepeophtheirus salmonis TaxID=72036 RepID=A0A0K2TKB8_LEPSM|nr:probable ATP-dependent RNA helicase vasa-like [Lepeophtheirus salmonis]
MSDQEEDKPKDVDHSTYEHSDSKKKCPTCSKSGHCKCPQVLPGTKYNSNEHKPRSFRTRNQPLVCYGCQKEGHSIRNCPSKATDESEEARHVKGEKRPGYIPKEESLDELFNVKLEIGDNFDNFDKVRVEVTPTERAPTPINLFRDTPFTSILQDNIARCSYTRPTPVQKHAVPIILMKHDLISCAQTGSGKTAAFLLPIIHSLHKKRISSNSSDKATPRTLILGPTRELVVQINDEARKYCAKMNIDCRVIYGGSSTESSKYILLNNRVDILSATPGRLIDMLGKEHISFENIEFLVIDEADRMLEMGFRESIDEVVNHFTMPGTTKRQTLLFSATFPPEIQILASEYLKDYLFLKVGVVGGASEDIEQVIVQVKDYEKMTKLLETLKENEVNPETKILIFARKKRGVDFLATRLCLDKHPATSIHGDRFQEQREEALRDFKRGSKPILVATEVASRGLDIPKVSLVINYDLPQDISTYVHRIGRSGRVGNSGKSISFYESEFDRPLAKDLVNVLKEAKQHVPEWLEKQGDVYYGGKRGPKSKRNSDMNSDIRKKKESSSKAELFKTKEEEEYWD